jgi:hypothetical protein
VPVLHSSCSVDSKLRSGRCTVARFKRIEASSEGGLFGLLGRFKPTRVPSAPLALWWVRPRRVAHIRNWDGCMNRSETVNSVSTIYRGFARGTFVKRRKQQRIRSCLNIRLSGFGVSMMTAIGRLCDDQQQVSTPHRVTHVCRRGCVDDDDARTISYRPRIGWRDRTVPGVRGATYGTAF